MTTAFEDLTDALVASLMASPCLAEGNVWANRVRVIPQGCHTAIVVRIERSPGREEVLGMLDWDSHFAIEVYGRSASGEDPAKVVGALLQAVWARFCTIDPSALNAMGFNLNPSIQWQFDELESPLACATFFLSVLHRTPANSLSA